MYNSATAGTNTRTIRIIALVAVAVVILAVAAYVWGTRLDAAPQRSTLAAPSYQGVTGIGGVRSFDSAPEGVSLRGVAAIRALDASTR